jgi:hypothetical protein
MFVLIKNVQLIGITNGARWFNLKIQENTNKCFMLQINFFLIQALELKKLVYSYSAFVDSVFNLNY